MNNDDISILHLSDLHIRNEGTEKKPYFSMLLKKLLDDIDVQTRNKKEITIVITGDIIDQGDYAQHQSAAISFFTKLSSLIGNRVANIFIVPGNHDKSRSIMNSLISRTHIVEGLNRDNEEAKSELKIEWEIQQQSYEPFRKLTRIIYKKFKKTKKVTNTFGVDVVPINGNNICFLQLDSAWCSHSENDFKKLRISEYQIESLFKEYREKRNQCNEQNNPIALTIALSHFPLNWLNAKEEKLCNDYFFSEEHMNVNILMCGHVHDFKVTNFFDHKHSLLTLVTGIGSRPLKPFTEKTHSEKSAYRYSLYSLNLFNNSCEIIMRKTMENDQFDYDYEIYSGTAKANDDKLRYPLKVIGQNAFIRINAPSPIETKTLFANDEIITNLPEVSQTISKFAASNANLHRRYIDQLIDGIMEEFMPDYNSPDISEEKRKSYDIVLKDIKSHLYEKKKLTARFKNKWLRVSTAYEDFVAFLNDICFNAVQDLGQCFSSAAKIRAHFRFHNEDDDMYPMLGYASNQLEADKSDMQEVSWDGLIKPAFKTEAPIIYSANKQYNRISTSWDDFLTIIPRFKNCAHDISTQSGKNESRPMLTFGISVKLESSAEEADYKLNSLILYLLGYLRLDKILETNIENYLLAFDVDLKNNLSRMQKIKNS